MTEADDKAVLALIIPTVNSMVDLQPEAKRQLLLCLLAQEICKAPAGERQNLVCESAVLLLVMMRSTQAAMREHLVENARKGA